MLVAADAAVMLIDAAKGVEAQTIKLLQGLPPAQHSHLYLCEQDGPRQQVPFALMEELEQVLGIRSCPMNWPIGVDGDFQGVYQRDSGNVLTRTPVATMA